MRAFWQAFYVACGLLAIILLFMIVNVFRGDRIEFTDQSTAANTPTIWSTDPYLGDPIDPKVTIIVFGDLTQNATRSLWVSLLSALEDFPEDVGVVWKDWPNPTLDPNSTLAALAARCAYDQGKYWEYHSAIIKKSGRLNIEIFHNLAVEVGLNEKKFYRCLKNQRSLGIIQNNVDEAARLQLTTAPTIFVDDMRYTGTMSSNDLRVIIRNILTP